MGSIDAPKSTENGSTPSAGGTKNHGAVGASLPPVADSVPDPPGNDALRKRKASFLPLEVNTRIMCRWRDGKFHPVKVIERRKLQTVGNNDCEYYVYYTECMKSFL